MSSSPSDSIALKCFAGGTGSGISALCTNPLDVIKIKIQQFGTVHHKYSTFGQAAGTLAREEGWRGFFKGASASCLRELTYSSVRLGLYEPIKTVTTAAVRSSSSSSAAELSSTMRDNSPLIKFWSAFLSGALGAAIFNPVDLVKVRFQSQLPGTPPTTPNGKPFASLSLWQAFGTIYQNEQGLRGWYSGVLPTVIRAACLTCAQIGSYDWVKNDWLVHSWGWRSQAVETQLAAALLSSVVTATAANPADVIKTRVMNDLTMAQRGNVQASWYYVGKIWKQQGPRGFLKGWTASYLRIGPHTIMSFLLMEQIRHGLGLASY